MTTEHTEVGPPQACLDLFAGRALRDRPDAEKQRKCLCAPSRLSGNKASVDERPSAVNHQPQRPPTAADRSLKQSIRNQRPAPRPPPPGPVCRALVHRPQATGRGGANKKTCRQSSAEGPMHRERKKRHGRVARTRRLKVQQRRLAGGWSFGQDRGPTSGVRQAFGRGMAVASSGCCAGGPQSAPHTHVLVCRGSTAQCWISVPTSPSFGLALAHSINTLCLHSTVLEGGG